jgi:hypothetical protein
VEYGSITTLLKFPPPPLRGDGRLTPLSSAEQMRREGKLMRSPIEPFISDVLSNKRYFYHWRDSEPATVMLAYSDSTGWRFAGALGLDKRRPSAQTRERIRAAVKEHLIIRMMSVFALSIDW